MAFTSVAARKFASPPCQQVRALSSRFSGSGCPESEGTRLSGARVITRADSFHSASTSTSLSDAPLDVPKRHVDTAHGVDGDAAPARIDVPPVHFVPEALGLKRIFSDQQFAQP